MTINKLADKPNPFGSSVVDHPFQNHVDNTDTYRNQYRTLTSINTQKNREYWQHIEKRANECWIEQYGGADYGLQILQGIIKYCRYRDRNYKKIVTPWLACNNLDSDELTKKFRVKIS